MTGRIVRGTPFYAIVLLAFSCVAGEAQKSVLSILDCEEATIAAGEARRDGIPAIPRPNIPANTFKITDFGAIADGTTLNSPAIKKAIAACSAAGGGTVVVPQGTFLTGPFKLESKISLHLDDGATLLMSNNPADFILRNGKFEDCISAADCQDISITGKGTIEGQGRTWWEKFEKARNAPADAPNPPHRPHLVVLRKCTRVLIQDVSLLNSPMFHLVPNDCEDVAVDGIRIVAPEDAHNTDGIDPSGRNFLIAHCYFDCGDDCIAVKPSGSGDAVHPSCENFFITDCTFMHGHGLSVGGQTPGGLRNLTVRNCRFEGTQAGIRLKASRGSGGLVENLTYENLTMKNVKVPILITSYYPKIPANAENDPAQPLNKLTPIWRHIRIDNLTAEGAVTAVQIVGVAEMPVSDIVLTHVKISAKKGASIIHAKAISFVDSSINASNGPALVVHDGEVSGIQH